MKRRSYNSSCGLTGYRSKTCDSYIWYVYSPDGQKLRATWQTAVSNIVVPLNSTLNLTSSQVSSTTRTDYIGNVIYTGTASSSSASVKLSKYLFEGGYATVTPTTQPKFHYYTQDHLGNNRAVVNQSGTVEQITHYYPFCGFFADQGTNSSLQPYKYNGKELDRTHGLDWYDYGARNYDATLCQFTAIDPLCEKYYHISPYAYCGNNPIRFIDPTGMFYGDYYDYDGNLVGTDGKDDNKKYLVLYKGGEKEKTVTGIVNKNGKTKKVTAVPVPSNAQVDAAQTSIDIGQKTGLEQGFVKGADGAASKQCSGKGGSVNLGPGYEELGKNADSDAHYHPFDLRMSEDGILMFSNTEPSTDDKHWRTEREKSGINSPNSPNWILGEEPNSTNFMLDSKGNPIVDTTTSIRFYWGKGKMTKPIPWEKFKTAVNIINGK